MVEGFSPRPVTNCSGIGKLGEVGWALRAQAWVGCVAELGRGRVWELDITGNRRRGGICRDRNKVRWYRNLTEQGAFDEFGKIVDIGGKNVAHLWAETWAMTALRWKALRRTGNNRL